MAKKRKSREQKIKADTRHFHYHFEPLSAPKNNPISSISPAISMSSGLNPFAISHPYLKHDLIRTILLTSAILASQVVLFIILKIHTFPFLGIKY